MKALMLALILSGCAAPTVKIPLATFAFELGYTTARLETLCERKKLPQTDCELAKDRAARAKAALDAPARLDWSDVLSMLMKLGMKAAL